MSAQKHQFDVTRYGRWAILGLALAGVACDPTGPNPPGTGGQPPSGGSAGTSGGVPTSGGESTSAGGAATTGGAASTGGNPVVTGGVPGVGGAAATGGSSAEGGTAGAGGSDAGTSEHAALWVLVVDPQGFPVPAAVVSVGAQPATSTSQGTSFFAEVASGRVVATVAAAGYADASAVVEIPGGVSAYTRQVIVPLGPPTRIDPSTTSYVEHNGLSVSLPANSLYDGDTLVTGPVDITITPLNPTLDLSSAPGPMQGVDVQGASVALNSVFMADFSAWSNGKRLTFRPAAGGPGARLRMPVPLGLQVQAGQVIPAWYYDIASGTWRQEGTGTVYARGSGYEWQVDVRHFTWWNCDHPDSEKTCLNATLQSAGGVPIMGASVTIEGLDYVGTSYAKTTDRTGSACIDFKRGSTASVKVLSTPSGFVPSPLRVVGGSAQATCQANPGSCQQKVIRVPGQTTCVSGTISLPDASPAAGARVSLDVTDASPVQPGVMTGVAASNGAYCFDVPASTAVSIRGVGRGSQGELLTSSPSAGASLSTGTGTGSCTTGGCVDHSFALGPVSTACYAVTLSRRGAPLPQGAEFQLFLGTNWTVDCSAPPSDWGALVEEGTVGPFGQVCLTVPYATGTYTLLAVDCTDPSTIPSGGPGNAARWTVQSVDQLAPGSCSTPAACAPLSFDVAPIFE